MFNNLFLVGLGGALGSMLRYLCQRSFNLEFPYGTLLVNLLGCFLIGMLWGLMIKGLNEKIGLFLMTGLCGGFTTYSAFSMETAQMLQQSRLIALAGYLALTIIGGLTFTFLGLKIFYR